MLFAVKSLYLFYFFGGEVECELSAGFIFSKDHAAKKIELKFKKPVQSPGPFCFKLIKVSCPSAVKNH
jgi:hypothetical protein